MKKILGLVLLSTILWSCGSQFNRSKYGNHMWNRSSGKNQVEKNEVVKNVESTNAISSEESLNNEVAISTVQNEDANHIASKKDENITALIDTNTIRKPSAHAAKKEKLEKRHGKNTAHTVYSNKKTLKSFNTNILNGLNHSSKNKHKSSGDDMLILMVILCLFPFINLIPVYMHDGDITNHFWITLILDLLLFLPGIIYSLLVVLDVI